MDITFRQLEIFRWVVVAGSITKASHRIGLSQPSISQQLAKLEEMLNVQLINRNRTGVDDDGRRILVQVKRGYPWPHDRCHE